MKPTFSLADHTHVRCILYRSAYLSGIIVLAVHIAIKNACNNNTMSSPGSFSWKPSTQFTVKIENPGPGLEIAVINR